MVSSARMESAARADHPAPQADRPAVYAIDCMGGPLGLEASATLLAPYAARPDRFDARRLDAREPGARAALRAALDEARRGRAAAFLYTGSKAYVSDPDDWVRDLHDFTRELVALERPVPVLGVCFGHQLIAAATGGEVSARPHRRGLLDIDVLAADAPILRGLAPSYRAVVTHRDHVVRLADRYEPIAAAPYCPIHAFRDRDPDRPVFGVQSHPEATRALLDWDEQIYRHGGWKGVSDADLAGCTAPRILTNFADLIIDRAGGRTT